MNKFNAGDKVLYLNLKNKRIEATIIRYRRLEADLFGQKVVHVVAELDNGELVNSRFLSLKDKAG